MEFLVTCGFADLKGLKGLIFFQVSGGGLPEEFQFSQFHFHWGSDDVQGSEHTINGVSLQAEEEDDKTKK